MRIQTYALDGNIGLFDMVIGSDGDNSNATRNYRVIDFLDYLGNTYNLQSVDLIYEYNAVASGSVGSGQISSNNFATNPNVLTSAITNLFVSKTTQFGQNVELFLETISADNFSMMVTDLDDPNNFAVVTINSIADVDADTLDLTVTVDYSNGSISTGTPTGLKVYPPSGGVSGNFVTLDTAQTITASKTFDNGGRIVSNNYILIDNDGNNIAMVEPAGETYTTFSGHVHMSAAPNNSIRFHWSEGAGALSTKFNFNSVTSDNELIVPDKNGTLALLDDLPDVPTRLTAITVSDASNNANVSTDLLILTIPPNTIADGDRIEFEGKYTVSAPPNAIGFKFDTSSSQHTYANTNAGTSVTEIHLKGYGVRVGTNMLTFSTITLDGDDNISTVRSTFSPDFTAQLDMGFVGGGSAIGAGDVVLNQGIVKLN